MKERLLPIDQIVQQIKLYLMRNMSIIKNKLKGTVLGIVKGRLFQK